MLKDNLLVCQPCNSMLYFFISSDIPITRLAMSISDNEVFCVKVHVQYTGPRIPKTNLPNYHWPTG